MKSILLSMIAMVLLTSLDIHAQSESNETSKWSPFGVGIQLGLSTQVHAYPLDDSNLGKLGEGMLPIWGLGIHYTFRKNSWFSVRPHVSYQQKGSSYRGRATIVRDGNSLSIGVGSNGDRFEFNNVFHYVGLGLNLMFKINGWKTKPYIQSGLKAEYLIARNVEYDLDEFSFHAKSFGLYDQYPSRTNYRDFETFNYGVVNSAGVIFERGWYVELNTNFDLGYVVKHTNLEVRHYVASLTFGMEL